MANPRSRAPDGPSLPWWRIPMVWLVIGGPLLVVVASLITAVVAIRGADVIVGQEPDASYSERPAVQARNHAATPQDKR